MRVVFALVTRPHSTSSCATRSPKPTFFLPQITTMVLTTFDIVDILESNRLSLIQLLYLCLEPNITFIEYCDIDSQLLRFLNRRQSYRYKFNMFVLRHRLDFINTPIGDCAPFGWDRDGTTDERFHTRFRAPNVGMTLNIWTQQFPDWDEDDENEE